MSISLENPSTRGTQVARMYPYLATQRAREPRRFPRTTDSAHAMAIRENLLARRFAVAHPNRAWVTDITYLWYIETFYHRRRRHSALGYLRPDEFELHHQLAA